MAPAWMATVLCITSSQPSLLYPGVELARRLGAAGHRTLYASWERARATVEHHGIEFVPLEPSRYEEFLAEDAKTSYASRLRNLRARRERGTASLGVGGFADMIREAGPDLILIDGELHEHIIAAWSCGAPIALLNSFVSIWRRPGLPPPHCLVRPGVGWKGSRPGIWLLWQALRLKKLRRAWSQWVRRAGCDRLSLLEDLAVAGGFDMSREIDAGQWLMPFTYRHLPVLSMHAEEFEIPHAPPQRVSYLGPLLLQDRGDDRLQETARARLRQLFEEVRSRKRSLVYAAFGSYFSTEVEFVRRLISAIEERPELELLISLGGRLEPEVLGDLPERVHAFAWLPQVEVLRHASLAVIHGGINTIDECVLSGVPMLVYCGFETDMGGNTARVVHHELGVAGDRRRDGPQAIRARIDRLLREPRFRANVERMKRRYRAYETDRVAERIVTSLI